MFRLQVKAQRRPLTHTLLNYSNPSVTVSPINLSRFSSSQEDEEHTDQEAFDGDNQELPSRYFRDEKFRPNVSKFKVEFDNELKSLTHHS